METIKQLISEGKTDEAIRLLDEYIQKEQTSDEAFYLRGNAYRKKGEVRQALNNYLTAMELNPESPAVIAHNQMISILNFYNKDMYNQ
ncbi:MAG: tetratricopeptide repeat protein [Parabacteroides sp.]|nr:tetratricopeptide repeat protein [Parabacteroides sp.]MBR2498037.1 tetratricopeptide repeat protein [Parabacteroides sp.]